MERSDNKKTMICLNKFTKLNSNLKLEIFDFISLEEKLVTIYFTNKSFMFALNKQKLFLILKANLTKIISLIDFDNETLSLLENIVVELNLTELEITDIFQIFLRIKYRKVKRIQFLISQSLQSRIVNGNISEFQLNKLVTKDFTILCNMLSNYNSNVQELSLKNSFYLLLDLRTVNNELIKMLSENNKLKILDHSQNKLGTSMSIAKEFFMSLRNNSSITDLILNGNKIGFYKNNTEFLAELLLKNKILKNLELDDNEFFKEFKNFISVNIILRFNSTLEKLSFKANNIGDNQAAFDQFFIGIQLNTGLQTLNLDSNRLFKIENYENFVNAMRENQKLSYLSLNDNYYAPHFKSIEKLCEGVKYSQSIKVLKLKNNNLGYLKKHIRFISELLKENKILENLDLEENSLYMHDENIVKLADALKANKTIKRINLSSNELGKKTIHLEALIELFKVNRSIHKFKFKRNKLDVDLDNLIRELLQEFAKNQNLKIIDFTDIMYFEEIFIKETLEDDLQILKEKFIM